MIWRNSLKVSLFLILCCCIQLSACSTKDLVEKPKKWLGISDDDNPRKPTKLTKIDTENVKGQSVWKNSAGKVEKAYNEIRPYITEERVYLTSAEGNVEAWQREGGQNIWSIALKEAVSGGVGGGDDIIVVGTLQGMVIGLAVADGVEQWRTPVSSEVISISQASQDNVVVRTNDSQVHALDMKTGEVVWVEGRSPPVLTLRGSSVPVIVEDKVLVGFDDGKLVAMDMRDGSELWKTSVSIPRGRSELERMADIDGEFVYDDGTVYVVNFNGQVIAVDFRSGRAYWNKDLSSSEGLSVDEKHVYVTDEDDSVWALDKQNGATIWRQDKLLFRQLTTPKIMGDYVVVGDYKGYLHWLSKAEGKLVGRMNLAKDAIKVAPVIVDERAYVLSNNGSFSVVRYRQ